MVEIDARFLELADAVDIVAKIEQIAITCSVPGTSGELYKTPSRLPMEQTAHNKELFRLVNREADFLGLSCIEELRSGVSDANAIAEAGIPVVDGMGPIGDCDHSEKEYMIKESLPARAKLAACTILSGWEHFHN